MTMKMNAVKRLTLRTLVLALACTMVAGAWAQSSEFKLDDKGDWAQERAPEPGSDEALISQASALLATDQPSRALRLITRWIDANEETDNPWLPRAYLLQGDALVKLNDEFKAMIVYERKIIQQYPQSEEFVRASERTLDIAIRYAHGLRRKIFGIRILSTGDIPDETLIRVQERLPGSALAERAAIELANLYYRRRDLESAAITYDIYIQNYPRGSNVAFAMERRIRANVAKYKGPDYDGSSLLDASEQTKMFQRAYPVAAQNAGLDDRLIQRLDDAAADQMLQGARWYITRDDQTSARFTLRRLLRRHPDSPAAAKALQLLQEHGWAEPASTQGPPIPDLPESEPVKAETSKDKL